jgi:hypothetical protein
MSSKKPSTMMTFASLSSVIPKGVKAIEELDPEQHSKVDIVA